MQPDKTLKSSRRPYFTKQSWARRGSPRGPIPRKFQCEVVGPYSPRGHHGRHLLWQNPRERPLDFDRLPQVPVRYNC